MGDGCISSYTSKYDGRVREMTVITCNAKKDYEYVTKYVALLFNSLFNVNATPRINKKSGVILYVIGKKEVFKWFKTIGFPVGHKDQIRIPKLILNKSINNINAVIRGLLDTDGCIFARKDEDYKYPYINIASQSYRLRLQLKKILRDQGFPAYVHNKDVYVRGIKNFNRWFELIGSNNPRILNKYEEFLNTGKIVPNNGPVAQR